MRVHVKENWFRFLPLIPCLLVGLAFGCFGPLLHDLFLLLSGDALRIAERPVTAEMLAVGLSTVVLHALTVTLILLIISSIGTDRGFGRLKVRRSRFLPRDPSARIAVGILSVIAIVTVEELGARWLFLDLLAPTIGFYAAFFIGNTVWALLHLFNYEKGHRYPETVLPQFLGGIIFTVMFRRYGLDGAVIAHLLWDFALFMPKWIHDLVVLRRRPTRPRILV